MPVVKAIAPVTATVIDDRSETCREPTNGPKPWHLYGNARIVPVEFWKFVAKFGREDPNEEQSYKRYQPSERCDKDPNGQSLSGVLVFLRRHKAPQAVDRGQKQSNSPNSLQIAHPLRIPSRKPCRPWSIRRMMEPVNGGQGDGYKAIARERRARSSDRRSLARRRLESRAGLRA